MKAQSHRDTLQSPATPQCPISTQLKIISEVLYKPLRVTIAELWLSLKVAVADGVFLHLFFFLNLHFPVLNFSLTPAVKEHLVRFPHHFISFSLLCLFYSKYFPVVTEFVCFSVCLACLLQLTADLIAPLWELRSSRDWALTHLWWYPNGSTESLVSAGKSLFLLF